MLTLRQTKGSALTHQEMDTNFIKLSNLLSMGFGSNDFEDALASRFFLQDDVSYVTLDENGYSRLFRQFNGMIKDGSCIAATAFKIPATVVHSSFTLGFEESWDGLNTYTLSNDGISAAVYVYDSNFSYVTDIPLYHNTEQDFEFVDVFSSEHSLTDYFAVLVVYCDEGVNLDLSKTFLVDGIFRDSVGG